MLPNTETECRKWDPTRPRIDPDPPFGLTLRFYFKEVPHMSSGEPQDPRRHPRYEVDAFADLTGTEILLNHKVCNISLGGICLQTQSVEEVGTIVDLVINFPDLESTIAVKGEVVWVNREPPEDMGIRYVELSDERKGTLKKLLQRLEKRNVG